MRNNRFYRVDEPAEPKPDTQSDIEKFLASGGKIKAIESGKSGLDSHALPQKYRKKIPRGNK